MRTLVLTSLLGLVAAQAGAAKRPRVKSVSPSSGAVGSGLIVAGGPFVWTDEVWIGEARCKRGWSSTKELSAEVPAGAASGPVRVVRDGKVIAAWKRTFTVVPRPAIASFAPGDGVPGDRVAISGSGFTDETAVWMIGGNVADRVKVKVVARAADRLEVIVPKVTTDRRFFVCNLNECDADRDFDVHEPVPLHAVSPKRVSPGERLYLELRGRPPGLGKIYLGAVELPVVKAEYRSSLSPWWDLVVEVPAGATSGVIAVENYGKTEKTKLRVKVQAP